MPALLIETIRFEGGKAQNLSLHETRMRHAGDILGFKAPSLPDLEAMHPPMLDNRTYKCRIIYRDCIESISFDPYIPRQIETVVPVQLPEAFDYSLKYLRRNTLDELRLSSGCDEVLLVNGKGLITDSSFSNLLFRRKGGGAWETPSTPLLRGVMRELLLGIGTTPEGDPVVEREISVSDLPQYREIAFINSMLPFEKAVICPIQFT